MQGHQDLLLLSASFHDTDDTDDDQDSDDEGSGGKDPPEPSQVCYIVIVVVIIVNTRVVSNRAHASVAFVLAVVIGNTVATIAEIGVVVIRSVLFSGVCAGRIL